MSSIIENPNRIGNFTSSEIYKLIPPGKGVNGFGSSAITYIEEKNLERKLGRCIKTDAYGKDMAWGTFLELRVFDLLGFEYELQSKTTNVHPTISCWSGSKDLIVPGIKIGEIKCYQPKNFAQYSDVLLKESIDLFRSECPEEYWQCVSNAIINQVSKAEGICYMPYQSELPEIREMAENYDGDNQWHYRFIAESEDSALAYLPNNGYYKNLNRFEFEVPQCDISLLTQRVLTAKTMLKDPTDALIAAYQPELSATIIEGIKLTKISK